MTKKIASGNHCGVSYFISIEDHGGKYKAQSTILFGDNFTYLLDWSDNWIVQLFEGRDNYGKHYYYEDPIKLQKIFEECTKGFIDPVREMISLEKKIESGLFDGIFQENLNDCLFKLKRLKQLREEAFLMQQKIRPETDPTPEQLTQMREQIEKLVSIFTMTGLASITGNSRQTVNGWLARGRVSAQAAHHMCQLDEVKAHGFTRESIRPDVKFWYI